MTVFVPKTKEYRRNLMSRPVKGNVNFTDLTMSTQKMLKDLFKSLVYIQINMEYNKMDIGEGKWERSDELFRYMDKYKDGFVTYDEFEQTLKANGLCVSQQDFKNLFDEFDRNSDGRITFDDFHSPGKREREALVD